MVGDNVGVFIKAIWIMGWAKNLINQSFLTFIQKFVLAPIF